MPTDVSNENDDHSGSDGEAAKAAAARAEVFNALHKEMELAEYATAASGNKVRRVPRDQLPEREAKRKALMNEDKVKMRIEVDDYDEEEDFEEEDENRRRKRLRGPMVAFDDVILKSMPLRGKIKRLERENQNVNKDGHDSEVENQRYHMMQEVASLGIGLEPDEVDRMDDFNEEYDEDYLHDEDYYDGDGEIGGGEDGEYGDAENGEQEKSGKESGESKVGQDKKEEKAQCQTRVTVSRAGLLKPTKTNKRVIHRLGEFASKRLAEKHGEAMEAHIGGRSETAVQKLRELAKYAPGAPQVYSSLGMVFESMLAEVERGEPEQRNDDTEVNSQLNHLQRCLELAQKSYASFHVASVLCKRDYVLWERAGDAAVKVAEIYSEIISHAPNDSTDDCSVSKEVGSTEEDTSVKGFDPSDGPEKWKSDRKDYLEHARSAYRSSDNLRPPGIDVPCKLAQVHMSLESFIEALTILTDLRNTASEKTMDSENKSGGQRLARSEMEASYTYWMLYADLMMKIGYECKKWNDGTSTNDDYMTKRWLRENSKKFDWQERRLQAICLALEAAAGSVSCTNLTNWMKKHSEILIEKEAAEAAAAAAAATTADDDNADEKNTGDNSEEAKDNDATSGLQANKLSYESEREKLLNMNNVELRKFDSLTKEMNLVAGSIIFNNRMAARAALVAKHRNAIKDLALRCKEEENTASNMQESENNEQPDPVEDECSLEPLPLQASRMTVYDIAALLLKQCIHLGLFEGGLLVVQSVLNYSRERVLRHDKSIEQRRETESLRNTEQGLIQPGFKYDKINMESDDSDEELGNYVSDDEDLDQPELVQWLKGGGLPIEIRAMHAICLLGVGGQDYVALNLAEQLFLSNELDSLGEDISSGAGRRDDSQFLAFSNHLQAPINSSFLLSFIATVVTKNVKVNPQSYRRVLSLLREHFLATIVDTNQGLDFDEVLSSPKEWEKTHALTTLLAALKLLIDCARMDLDHPDQEVSVINQAVTDSIYVLKIMLRFKYILWNPSCSDWSLPEVSLDTVSVLSGAIYILSCAVSLVQEEGVFDTVLVGLTKSRQLISTICQADNTNSRPIGLSPSSTWQSFPLPCSWQTSFHEKISLRTYNLCVASCVSSFSGWEPLEFNLDQLRDSEKNFFGVSFEGRCVAGFLPKDVASATAEQWDHVSQILPDLEELPFEADLEDRKNMNWYQKVMRNIEKQGIASNKISTYREEDGIRALLSYSSLCLTAAERSDGDRKDDFVKLAMSVLLPLTQFSIDTQVWQSTIGTLVMSARNGDKVGYFLDENCQWLGPTKKQDKMKVANKTQRTQGPKEAMPTRKLSRHNIIKVPTSVLLEEWRKDDTDEESRVASEDARKAMMKLDSAMKNLRQSRTLNSLERSSIDVAVALISLVSFDECENPFVCMQQAAMFAAMGSKRGNNDEPFKRFLPLKKKCTPVEALNILCRADCLRAVHFLHEAQFLCTWVASVTQSHRDVQQEELPWNSRWRTVGILTYIVSATIDETGEGLSLSDSNTAGALRKWVETAKEEIGRGKSDALVIVTINPNSVPFDETPLNEENPVVEEEDDDNQNDITEMIQQKEHIEAVPPAADVEQFLYEELNIPQDGNAFFEDEVIEGGDDDDPFAGVEAVAI